tara:strand:- start:31 stop:294 length:264 start_codon:yes stop_codon:yes gene_type:complete
MERDGYERARKNIVKKLYANKSFHKGHLLLDTLKKGVPVHLQGHVKKALKDLLREGLVVKYGMTKHGEAYQLNIRRLGEIERLVFGG